MGGTNFWKKFMSSTIFILTCIIINFLQILFTIGSFIIVSLFVLSSVFGVFITFFLFLQNCNCQGVHASMYMCMCIHVLVIRLRMQKAGCLTSGH